MKIGVITYDFAHLKTEQVVTRLCTKHSVKLLALPFRERPRRPVLFDHRPDMSRSVPTEQLSELAGVAFQRWDGTPPAESFDHIIITGAGIIDPFAPIINAHPGVIPLVRGLDAFKWSILDDQPLGVTLHYIDQNVDAGEVVSCRYTPLFPNDDLLTLARRHYELEIEMLTHFTDYLPRPRQDEAIPRPARKRMTPELEAKMVRKFDSWLKSQLGRKSSLYEKTAYHWGTRH